MRRRQVVSANQYRELIQRILKHGEQNIELGRRERTHLIFMAHAIQELVALDQVASLLSKKRKVVFEKIVVPLLGHSSRIQRRRAWAAPSTSWEYIRIQ